MIAVGILSHHVSGNQLKAFAAENKINKQQATSKESVQQNQTNSKVQNNINKTTGSLNNVKNKQQTYTNVNATQQKQHIPLTKSEVGTSKHRCTKSYNIIYIYKGSTKLGSGTVNAKGTYTINIRPQKKGTTLVMYAKDKANNKSASLKLKVK